MKLTAALTGFAHGLARRAFAGFGIAPHTRPYEALGAQMGQPCNFLLYPFILTFCNTPPRVRAYCTRFPKVTLGVFVKVNSTFILNSNVNVRYLALRKLGPKHILCTQVATFLSHNKSKLGSFISEGDAPSI